MNNTKRVLAAAALGSAVLLGALVTPASADDPFVPAAQGSSTQAPGDWTWKWSSTMQNQNGLLNLANNGNVCAGLVGALAPATTCTTS